MNEQQHRHGGNGGYEHEDMGAKTVYAFLFILAVVGVIVYFVVGATYHGLDRYFDRHQAAQSPLKETAPGDTREVQTQQVKANIERSFPQPLLEDDERNELNNFRTQEADQLSSYGWVDQKAGVVHIPIERAMQLMAARGLPVRPGETGSAAAAKPAAAAKNNKTAK